MFGNTFRNNIWKHLFKLGRPAEVEKIIPNIFTNNISNLAEAIDAGMAARRMSVLATARTLILAARIRARMASAIRACLATVEHVLVA